jgi:hypothetical protein
VVATDHPNASGCQEWHATPVHNAPRDVGAEVAVACAVVLGFGDRGLQDVRADAARGRASQCVVQDGALRCDVLARLLPAVDSVLGPTRPAGARPARDEELRSWLAQLARDLVAEGEFGSSSSYEQSVEEKIREGVAGALGALGSKLLEKLEARP